MKVSEDQKRIDDMIFKIAGLEDENAELKKRIAELERWKEYETTLKKLDRNIKKAKSYQDKRMLEFEKEKLLRKIRKAQ